jgi:hypothetical protein
VYRIGVDTPVIEVDEDHLDHLPAIEAILEEASSQEDASR